MAEKKKILYIVEAMGGGVFTYIVDLANELVNSYDIAAGLNVILNFILIPKYGYVAAAYTTLASYFVAFILHSRYAKKIEPDIYPLKMFALPLLHVGGAIILYYPLLNFWTLRWGILFVYLIIVLIKERFRIGTLVPVLAEKCSFFKEK